MDLKAYAFILKRQLFKSLDYKRYLNFDIEKTNKLY